MKLLFTAFRARGERNRSLAVIALLTAALLFGRLAPRAAAYLAVAGVCVLLTCALIRAVHKILTASDPIGTRRGRRA